MKQESATSELWKYANDTLEYLNTREKLWKKQTKVSKDRVIDFSPDNLAQFYEEDQITLRKNPSLKVEDTEEKELSNNDLKSENVELIT